MCKIKVFWLQHHSFPPTQNKHLFIQEHISENVSISLLFIIIINPPSLHQYWAHLLLSPNKKKNSQSALKLASYLYPNLLTCTPRSYLSNHQQTSRQPRKNEIPHFPHRPCRTNRGPHRSGRRSRRPHYSRRHNFRRRRLSQPLLSS